MSDVKKDIVIAAIEYAVKTRRIPEAEIVREAGLKSGRQAINQLVKRGQMGKQSLMKVHEALDRMGIYCEMGGSTEDIWFALGEDFRRLAAQLQSPAYSAEMKRIRLETEIRGLADVLAEYDRGAKSKK